MPPAPKEARVAAAHTSPHRLAHHHHLTRLPLGATRHTLSATGAEAERRAACPPAVYGEVRRDATGCRLGLSLTADAAPVVWCVSGGRVLITAVRRTGPVHTEVNASELILAQPEEIEAWMGSDGRGLALLHRLTGRLAYLPDVFAAARTLVAGSLAVSADETVEAVNVEGDVAVALTTLQNVFVIGQPHLQAGQPVPPYPCKPARSMWRLGSFFSRTEEPLIIAQWSQADRSVVVVKGRSVEKWRDGFRVAEFTLEPGTAVKALHLQSADVIHVLYCHTAASDREVPEREGEGEGLRYGIAHYHHHAPVGHTALAFRYPAATRCYLACSEAGERLPQCIMVALDNLLVVATDGQEDVLLDDFFTFAYHRTPRAVWLLRHSGVWTLKFPRGAEPEDLGLAEDAAVLPTGVTAATAVAHSRRIADGSLTGPASWAQYAQALDDAALGTLMAKAMAHKRATHRSFVAALHSAGVWDLMLQSDKRQVHEHGEKLAACHALRKLQNEQYAAKSPAQYLHETQAFLLDLMKEAVEEGDSGDPATASLSVQEKFYSQATQVHRLLGQLRSLADHPQRLARALEQHRLPAHAAVAFLGQALQEMFRAILAHRDVYGQQRAQQELGRTEWTRRDDFRQCIQGCLSLTHQVITGMSKVDATTSDDLLLVTDLVERTTLGPSDPAALDPAGTLLRQQAHIIDYALEFTAEDGRAAPDMVPLVQKYLVDPAREGQPLLHRRPAAFRGAALEPARELAEKWQLFGILIDLAKPTPTSPPDATLIEPYLRRFKAAGFHVALFDHYRSHGDWRGLLAVPGVDQELAEYLEKHNPCMAAVHRLRYAAACDAPEVPRQLHASAALFQDAAQRETDMRTRKATLSLAKLVLHLKTLRQPTEVDHRHMAEMNNELQVLKLQQAFLEGEPAYLPPDAAIRQLGAAALARPDRQGRIDRLEAALQLNRQQVDCSAADRTKRAKYVWSLAFQAEEKDWKKLSDVCREGAPESEVRAYVEESLICRLRAGLEGASLTPKLFAELQRQGAFAGIDERLVDTVRDCLFATTDGAPGPQRPRAVRFDPEVL